MEPTDPVAALNASLSGRYRIEREIGAGGMARVYLAEDLRHHRPVALKVMRRDVADSVGAERFLQEIEIAARLQHPNILPLLDSGEADGRVFYVMPYVEGSSLRERLDREGELPVSEAARILVEVADALSYAHGQDVVHRDVKPENVMISGRHALVTDFGVARALAAGAEADRMTMLGRAVGTPAYMAPEQAAADPHVDHRADIYSLGVLAYELLTGRPPFSGRTAQEILAAQVTETPEPVSKLRPGVPLELEEVILRCLAKRPADRWQSAEEIRARLEPLATPGAGTTPTSLAPVRAAQSGSWKKAAAALVAVGAVVAVVALWGTGLGSWIGAGGGSDIPLTLGQATRLTAESGLETHPDISPDGSLVVYAAGEATRMRLYIRPVMGGRTISLTEASSAFEFQPRWSPDGTRILFLTPDGAYVASALGGTAQRIAGPAGAAGPFSSYGAGEGEMALNAAAWSPDGGRVFLARGGELSILDLAAGTEEPLTTLSYELHSCDWSPGGDWIACTSGNWEAIVPGRTYGNIAPSAVILVHTEDGRVREITDRSALNESPVWSPDGRLLYFVSNRQGPRDVYAVEIGDDGSPRAEPRRMTTGLDAQSIAFSGDGRRLTYVSYQARANLWSLPIPPSGEVVDAGTATRLTSENQIVESMRVSWDDRWLLYDSNLHGSADVFRIPVGGGTPERLTEHPADDFAPDLSPDGRELVFHSWRTGSRDIFVQPVAGGPAQQLTDSPFQESYPVWSPDGNAVAFYDQWQEEGEPRGLFVVRRDDSGAWGEPELVRHGTYTVSWAPDASFIAYSMDGVIEVIPPGGGEPRVVYRAGSDDPDPERVIVSDDGRTLYFKSHDAEVRASLWSVPVAGGEPRLLVRFDDPVRPSIRSDFAVGAGRFFFTLEDRQSDIWVAEMVER